MKVLAINSIRIRLFGYMMAMLIFLGLLSIGLVYPFLMERFQDELIEKAEFMAGSLAGSSLDYLLARRDLQLKLMLSELPLIENDMVYAYVQDAKGRVVAHTFEKGFPVGLEGVNPVSQDGGRHRLFQFGAQSVIDVGLPIREGDLGSVHIGLAESESIAAEHLGALFLVVSTIIGAVVMVGLLMIYFLTSLLTRPLSELVQVVRGVGNGNFEQRAKITSNDEIGQLGAAFNTMIDNLKQTTVSKDAYREQTAFLHQVLGAIPYPFYVIDVTDYSIELANPATADEEVWRNTTCHQLTHNSATPCGTDSACRCPLAEVQKTGLPVTLEHVHCRPDGSQQNYEVHGYPIFDNNGNLFRMIEFSIDITARKNAEVELLESRRNLQEMNLEIDGNRQRLQVALDELSRHIQSVTHLGDFTVRFVNPHLVKCYEMKGCSKAECGCYGIDKPLRCWQIAGTFCGSEVSGDFAMKLNDCKECQVYQAAVPDPVQEIGEYFNNMMHILESKNSELESAYQELKNTHSQMLQQEKMASIGQLAAGVAHEINNPMGFITSNLGTLGKYSTRLSEFLIAVAGIVEGLNNPDLQELVGKKRKEFKVDYILGDISDLVSESLDGAKRVSEIVKNLKSFARLDEQGLRPADINECLDGTLKIIWNELKYKAKVEKEFGDLPKTMCLPMELNQVFMNILVNAAQAIEDQGDIRIKTWSAAGRIYVAISDTGCGIDPDKINKVFEPFYTSKPVGKGTGLGMSISYDIIKKHEGEISIVSEVGRGTTFTVALPVK